MTAPTSVSFVIPGPPVGKARHRTARRGASMILYTPQKTVSYENLVKAEAWKVMRRGVIFDGPLVATINVCETPPQSWSKKKKQAAFVGSIMPTSKPDADNIAKTILDACNGIVFEDDKQVCSLIVQKRYSEQSETRVTIGTYIVTPTPG